jgi:hypothetical protein
MPDTVRMILLLWGRPEHTTAWARDWLRTLHQIRDLPTHEH